jgi:hypothetical protein
MTPRWKGVSQPQPLNAKLSMSLGAPHTSLVAPLHMRESVTPLPLPLPLPLPVLVLVLLPLITRCLHLVWSCCKVLMIGVERVPALMSDIIIYE